MTLGRPLHRAADGKAWITQADIRAAFGAEIKQLIPRPTDGRRRRQRPPKHTWILASATHCGLYKGQAPGAGATPDLELGAVARTLGYRLQHTGTRYNLRPQAVRGGRSPITRARVGSRVSDMSFSFLDGTSRSIASLRGKRLLILTWASWSKTRTQLAAWRAATVTQGDPNSEVWMMALDVEGSERVRRYAPATHDVPVGLDRNADLARLVRLDDVGRWYWIDELGILRAEGQALDAVDKIWLDEHRREDLTPTQALPAPTLTVLRERVAAEPENIEARLALDAALAPEVTAERIANARALRAARPKSLPFAFRLAALLHEGRDAAGAREALDLARRDMSQLWAVRKQYWALAHPERFYSGPIDLVWQAAERKREREWLDPPGKRRKRKKGR